MDNALFFKKNLISGFLYPVGKIYVFPIKRVESGIHATKFIPNAAAKRCTPAGNPGGIFRIYFPAGVNIISFLPSSDTSSP